MKLYQQLTRALQAPPGPSAQPPEPLPDTYAELTGALEKLTPIHQEVDACPSIDAGPSVPRRPIIKPTIPNHPAPGEKRKRDTALTSTTTSDVRKRRKQASAADGLSEQVLKPRRSSRLSRTAGESPEARVEGESKGESKNKSEGPEEERKGGGEGPEDEGEEEGEESEGEESEGEGEDEGEESEDEGEDESEESEEM